MAGALALPASAHLSRSVISARSYNPKLRAPQPRTTIGRREAADCLVFQRRPSYVEVCKIRHRAGAS